MTTTIALAIGAALRAAVPRKSARLSREDELRMAAEHCLRRGADRRVVWGNFADVLPSDFF